LTAASPHFGNSYGAIGADLTQLTSSERGSEALQSRVKLKQPSAFVIPSPRFKSPATVKGAFWPGEKYQNHAPGGGAQLGHG
jgi:hypothetical protein